MPGKDPTVILNAVPPDEPEGYRGRRRRFWITRKGGGVALPALLVAASVVVVLIVVGVSQLLPHEAAGQIPLGGGNGNGTVSDDNGQAQPDSSNPGSPSGSAHPSKSPSVKPSPSPSGGVSQSPSVPGAPPPPPTTTASTGKPFTPVAMEAESGAMAGGAASSGCTGCSAGRKVRNIGNNAGSVTIGGITVPSAGTYQLTITYELGQPSRTFYLSINGGAGTPVTVTSNVTDWSTQLNATVPVTLTAGGNSFKFYNPTANFAPDLDKITVG